MTYAQVVTLYARTVTECRQTKIASAYIVRQYAQTETANTHTVRQTKQAVIAYGLIVIQNASIARLSSSFKTLIGQTDTAS